MGKKVSDREICDCLQASLPQFCNPNCILIKDADWTFLQEKRGHFLSHNFLISMDKVTTYNIFSQFQLVSVRNLTNSQVGYTSKDQN